ncbi:MAG: translational GTPase TypA [Peptococcaceae bacterium]|jgi:GTP-binding protein|nr:translational GTPase TypA [Peptococcaceae bacterium]
MAAGSRIRNVAIIAHVDHGKTTLVDKLLAQAGGLKSHGETTERIMDSNDLERERGITILAKNTAIQYGEYIINIVDTPGHADFGGEVERIMKMVDGVLLVVDAFEGCMPQTRFVMRKAIEQGLKPIVVVNKMDRENARPAEVVDEVLDLLIDLGADEEDLDFPVVYASAVGGWASTRYTEAGRDMVPIYESILRYVPAPKVEEGSLRFQVTLLDYNDYLGRIAIGRISRGSLRAGGTVEIAKRDGGREQARVTKLFGFRGLERIEMDEIEAGDMAAVAGLGKVSVGETAGLPGEVEALPLLKIDEPTLQMNFLVNNSPFAGRDGEPVTARKLAARLLRETETDVSLRVDETERPEVFTVSGRGELHLSILIETMRREGMEFQVSMPQVIVKEIDGAKCEPFEYMMADVPEEAVGTVMEKMGSRRGELLNMETKGGWTRLAYSIPARGLVGFRTEFLTDTKGYGIMNHTYDGYKPWKGEISRRRNGALIAWETGVAKTYGLLNVESRGTLFIAPGTDVYEGMIVGENSREQDLAVNVCKEKQMSNMRSSTKEETVKLKAPRNLSLEQSIEYIADDELVEVTPKSIRLRKLTLQKNEREKYEKARRL